MSDNFNEEKRFGSARLAEESEIRRAGLLRHAGLQFGYWKEKPIYLNSDAPMITVAGAGAGKLRDCLGYVVTNSPGVPMLVLDPRGELYAVSQHIHAINGEYAYPWNPMGIAGGQGLSCDLLDILDPASPYFHADCKFVAESLIALSSSGDGKYFEQRAREWLENLIKSLALMKKRITLSDLYRLITVIETDSNTWASHLEVMLASPMDSVRRVAAEMLTKQQETPKEFGAIMGTIYANLNFLDDPQLLKALDEPDFSLRVLTDPHRVSKVFLNIPSEYLSLWAPLIRLFFAVAMIYKTRAPEARRVTFLVDEAGQLQRADVLMRAVTFGRGVGIRAWPFFQSIGQITRHYGREALQDFIGSAQLRQFFGVRDYETAQLVSNMLGMETLEYDNDHAQAEARKRKRDIAHGLLMEGKDPFAAAHEYRHFKDAEVRKTKQARSLMTPDEIMNMPEDRQVVFISGKDLPPIYGWKYPYFARREMAGLYMPNPYHPPADEVRIKGRFGSKRVRVITEPVPNRFASFPQYKHGIWSYLQGFKP